MRLSTFRKYQDELLASVHAIHACQIDDDAQIRKLAKELKTKAQKLATAARGSELRTCKHDWKAGHQYADGYWDACTKCDKREWRAMIRYTDSD